MDNANVGNAENKILHNTDMPKPGISFFCAKAQGERMRLRIHSPPPASRQAGAMRPGFSVFQSENKRIVSGRTEENIMMKECLEQVRTQVPLVHNITNYVTVNDVANVLLACGGSPIMSDEAEDVEDITSVCGGLNINIGTLHKTSIEGMYRAGRKANELDHPVLLDPVGAGASRLRTETALGLMKELRLAAIRGNISEIKTLSAGSGTTRGVDADVADAVTEENLDAAVEFVKGFAREAGCIVAVTGAIDLVSDGSRCYVICNGRPEMGKITGTGCQLSGIMTAYLVANPDNRLEAAAAAVCLMGLAGEIGWSRMQEGEGNSTYRNRIIDAIYNMTGEELEKGARYELR